MKDPSGRVQRAVIDELKMGSTLRNELCWRLSDGNGPSLPNAYYASFSRAVTTLVSGHRVVSDWRRLRDSGELVRFYPFKTRDRAVRDLRSRLLPTLSRLLPATPKLSEAGQEDLVVHRMRKESSKRFSDAADLWAATAQQLLTQASKPDRAAAGVCVDLLTRGQNLFSPGGGGSGGSGFRALAAQLEGTEITAQKALVAIRDLCFGEDEMAAMRLKASLYELGEFGRDVKRSSLNYEVKRLLFKAEPAFVASLPGHVSSAVAESPYELDRMVDRTSFSRLLDQLVDRHVFGRFEFLSLPD